MTRTNTVNALKSIAHHYSNPYITALFANAMPRNKEFTKHFHCYHTLEVGVDGSVYGAKYAYAHTAFSDFPSLKSECRELVVVGG